MSPIQACRPLAVLTVLTVLAVSPVVHAAGGAPTSAPMPVPSPGQPDVSGELAEAQRLIDQKDWRAALTQLKIALRKAPRNPDVHNLMGYSYRKSGQLDDAFDSYNTALQLDPRHKGAHEYIGEAYLQANQPAKAREHLAALKSICGEACEEYQDLAKALAAYHTPPAAAK
jgi:Flp pilus assembly protein TadD